jgi:hypothetical protein
MILFILIGKIIFSSAEKNALQLRDHNFALSQWEFFKKTAAGVACRMNASGCKSQI